MTVTSTTMMSFAVDRKDGTKIFDILTFEWDVVNPHEIKECEVSLPSCGCVRIEEVYAIYNAIGDFLESVEKYNAIVKGVE